MLVLFLKNEAIEEAIAWGRMQSHLNGIKEAYKLARHRASQELSTALDAGGAVFLIGTGAFEEFTGEAPESVEIGGFPREKWSTVRELWSSRVSCISNEPRVSSSECDDYSSGFTTKFVFKTIHCLVFALHWSFFYIFLFYY